MTKKSCSQRALLAEKAFKEAVKEAIALHAKMGVVSVFMKDNKICYKMPDGTISYKPPSK